jgi:hypothetical protein
VLDSWYMPLFAGTHFCRLVLTLMMKLRAGFRKLVLLKGVLGIRSFVTCNRTSLVNLQYHFIMESKPSGLDVY